MKRALAERVKQEFGDPVLQAPASSPSAYGNGVAPHHHGHHSKVPKLEAGQIASSSSASRHTSLSGSMTAQGHAPPLIPPVSKKRPRSPPNADSSGNVEAYQSTGKARGGKPGASDDDEDDKSAFFLKHQNSALASELYAYRRRIYLLEREREYRRKECRAVDGLVREVRSSWRGLEEAIGQDLRPIGVGTTNGHTTSGPNCTGTGADVESSTHILHSLLDLVSNPNQISTKMDHDDPEDPQTGPQPNDFESYTRGITVKLEPDEKAEFLSEKILLDDMEGFVGDLAARTRSLKDGILNLLRNSAKGDPGDGGASESASSADIVELKARVSSLQSRLSSTTSQLEEMANSRNEAGASERRVRRALYRLASGRMTLEEIMAAVEKDDGGASFSETLADIDAVASKPPSPGSVHAKAVTADSTPENGCDAGESSANPEEIAQLKKSLQDVQAVAESRDEKISELLSEREHHLKQINDLVLSKKSAETCLREESIRKSPLFVETLSRLNEAERKSQELESQTSKIMAKWSAAKGDLDLAKKTLVEMEEKHSRRWAELVEQFSESDRNRAPNGKGESSTNDAAIQEGANPFSNARRTAELELHLRQALEGNKRTEKLRESLDQAHKMNEQLQAKFEEMKAKNAKMVAEKVAARGRSKESGTDPTAAPPPQSGDKSMSPHSSSSSLRRSISSSDPAVEKLQRDYRRARKEVSAAVLSKDQAKLKQERAEKERDTLLKTNARLLQQSSTKDDMNAQSLSNILHLQQKKKELEKEKVILLQKTKAAEQLGIAARLASNARDKVGEELLKEKEALDEKVKQQQGECQQIRAEKDAMQCELAKAKEALTSVSEDLAVARKRCDDLVSEGNAKEQGRKSMMESLAVLRKEASESAKLASASGCTEHGGGDGSFTMEQMQTQVKYLSSRVTCPVCNVREKNVILLRCRHMFCQQCVDVNIKNRSRKCPACAQRFDMKDVAEIWL
mmetsp:Transcript_35598/g.81380  ORF Transcript_35598/g.81380 Transcript_35598/m.81380 type:complete len:973 (-) Transcript_35598:68-2986(-)